MNVLGTQRALRKSLDWIFFKKRFQHQRGRGQICDDPYLSWFDLPGLAIRQSAWLNHMKIREIREQFAELGDEVRIRRDGILHAHS